MRRSTVVLAFLAVSAAPCAFGQPSLEVLPIDGGARPGKPFHVRYEVTWPESGADYVLEAPEADGTLGWGSATFESIRTTVRDGMNVATLTLRVEAPEAGDYALAPMRLTYIERKDTPEPPEKDQSPNPIESVETLVSDPLDITVRPAYTVLWTSSAVVSALALALGGWIFFRRRGGSVPSAAAVPGFDSQAAMACVHSAKARRLDGAYYEYYLELQQAVDSLGSHTAIAELSKRLRRSAQEVGYQGQRPSDDDMDGALREVERALSKARAGEPFG